MFQVAMNMPNLTTLQLSNNVGLRGPLLPANAEPITTATCALSTVSPCQNHEHLQNIQNSLMTPLLMDFFWVCSKGEGMLGHAVSPMQTTVHGCKACIVQPVRSCI